MKALTASALGQQNTAQQSYITYCIGAGQAEPLPDGTTYDDLFNPAFWVHHAAGPRALKAGDLIRVRARDGSFDVVLHCAGVPKGGAIMEVWPKYPAGDGVAGLKAAQASAEVARPKVVPFLPNGKTAVRVEHTPATKHRVIALDQSEHSRGHDTQAQAEAAMAVYLKELCMVMPSAEEIAAAEEKAAADAKARKERADRERAERAHARSVRS